MATAASGSSASSSDGEASGCCARAGCCDGKGGGCIWETTSAHATPWRARLYGLMFEYSGTSGTVAAVVIFTSIVLSVTLVCLGSVAWISATLWVALVMDWIELLFIIIFGAEYLLRSLSVKRWHTYGLSVFGIVDFISVVPAAIGWALRQLGVAKASGGLVIFRIVRVLRIFRMLKAARYVEEFNAVAERWTKTHRQVLIFTIAFVIGATMIGCVMFTIEDGKDGFTSIPEATYWAIVTLTTVGYGDVAPESTLGQCVASAVMVAGYGIIVVFAGASASQPAPAPSHQVVRPGDGEGGGEYSPDRELRTTWEQRSRSDSGGDGIEIVELGVASSRDGAATDLAVIVRESLAALDESDAQIIALAARFKRLRAKLNRVASVL